MLSKTHKLTEEITTTLGPLFREQPDYTVIQQAIGLVIARIAMATPNRGKEFLELSIIHEYSQKALKELLNIERKQGAQKTLVEQGVGKFAALFADKRELGIVALNGGMGSEAQAAAEEAQSKYSDNEMEWPQYNERSWSPAQEETEQARLDTYKED